MTLWKESDLSTTMLVGFLPNPPALAIRKPKLSHDGGAIKIVSVEYESMSDETDDASAAPTEIHAGPAAEVRADVEPERPEQPRGRPFEKGNPGRPRGSKNKTTAALEELLDGQAEAITNKVVEKALEGDRAAMRLCFERILPLRVGRALSFDLPAVKSTGDAASAMSAIVAAVGAGEITPAEATEVSQLIDAATRAFEVRDFDRRLEATERRIKFLEKRNESDTKK